MNKTRNNIFKMLICAMTIVCLVVLPQIGFSQEAKRSVMIESSGEQALPSPTTGHVAGDVIINSGGGGVYMCPECCDECYGGARGRSHVSNRANASANACFNCRVNGSYKYPVPRQYTYFWPGIYSQKRMTDYVAPYQGLFLESPAKVFND